MRRIALILLMALLPLQSIWAAASHACPHGRVSAGEHATDFTHEHTHDQAHAYAGADAASDNASADADSERDSGTASTCHGQGSAAVFARGLVAPAPAAAGIVPSPYARFVADRFLESALRPPVLHHA